MTIDTLRRIVTEYDISCCFEAENTVKEVVDRYENFYELQIREKEAVIFYIEREKRNEMHKLCCIEWEAGIAWFAALLLSKKELEYNRESLNKMLLPMCGQPDRNENIESIGTFKNNYEYSFVKNEKIPVNLVKTKMGYELAVNINNKCIYKENLNPT